MFGNIINKHVVNRNKVVGRSWRVLFIAQGIYKYIYKVTDYCFF